MSAIGPKGKDLSVFVRFGGLNLKRQRGFSLWPEGPCSPPARRGFYAFPKVSIDWFYIGGIHETQPSIFPESKRGSDQEKWAGEDSAAKEAAERHRKHLFSLIRREFCKLHGTVWSHLGGTVRRPEIIATHGHWVKTTMREWRRAFAKETVRRRLPPEPAANHRGTKCVNRAEEITGRNLASSFEVFFDEDV